ncbi:RTA-like protein [Macrophomina phaseolina MS6]|uniref:RTA-like protein n=1 Tax=Macrophomina phaseolina (strain MS6) TaxID=1126212 RepID=K2SBZ3_MACPH|nr:RTA-like protein [Macrophomina phaseolina MS6]
MSSTYHPSLDDPNAFVFYRYHPSMGAAVFFILAFMVTTFLHCWQCVRTRTWYFIPLILGGFCKHSSTAHPPIGPTADFSTPGQWIGYIGRAMSAHDQWALGPYMIQSMLLLIAPALFAASVYMILGRIILVTDGEKHSVISKKWLTKIFVIGDTISLLTQSGGGGIMAAGSLDSMKLGEKIVIVGLFIQLIFFGFFMYASSRFFARIRASPTARSLDSSLGWEKHFWVLMAVSLLIFVRSVFRVIEYCSGNNGYLLKHEIFLYLFDACLMLAVMVVFNVVHPSQITNKLGGDYVDTYKMYLNPTSEV